MEKDVKISDLSQEEKEQIINKIDRQIKIDKAVEDICKKIDDDKKLDEEVKKIDSKIIEICVREKSPIKIGNINFTYNEKYDWYESSVDIDNENICIHTYGMNNIEDSLNKAIKYFDNLDVNKLKNIIADEYYESDKDGELQGTTREEFLNNLSLVSIQVDSKYVEYWFDDNDMYGGHNIVVSTKHDEEKYTIDMAG
ncbi:MAG: DUF2262 domain-containing protein [Bacilli bacterium]|nr:DUF2262 domain-containing protein [Bacilli bacterium]